MIEVVHQVLHGYDRGHRLLAASLELTAEELYRLDRLSDLSGYPGRDDPPSYLSGYPTGRYYVVARTWIEPRAERRGTVWTHSLLVPIHEIRFLDDIGAMSGLFRQPMLPVDLSAYRMSLSYCSPFNQSLRTWTLAGVVAAWFEHEREPMVWVDAESGETAARTLWWCLPPDDRATFAFCTHALLARYVGDRLFDWVATTPEALRLFGDTTTQLRVVHPDLGGEPSWVEQLVRNGPATWSQIESRGLRVVPGQRKVALRYEELRGRGDIASILGCIDLLRLLPTSVGEVEAVQLVKSWLDSAAPCSYGDLGPLLDLLAREPARLAPALQEQLADRVWREVRRAAPTAPGWQISRLWQTGDPLKVPAQQALVDVATALDVQTLCEWFTHVADLVAPCVDRLPDERRSELLVAARDQIALGRADAALLRTVAAASHNLKALLAVAQVGDVSILDLGELVYREHPDANGWGALLTVVGAPSALSWWNAHPEATGAREIAEFLARDALEIVLDDVNVAPHVIDAVVSRAGRADLSRALRESSERLRRAWVAVQSSADSLPAKILAEAVREAASSDELMTLMDLSAIPQWANRSWAAPMLDTLVGEVLRRGLSGADPVAWSALSADWIQTRLGRLTFDDWRWLAEQAPIAVAARWLALPGSSRARESSSTVERLFRAWTHRPWSWEAVAPTMVEALLSLPGNSQARAASLVLDRCFREPSSEASVLVTAAFPIVHRAICSGQERYPLLRFLERWIDDDWDKAKHLRRALVRAWVAAAWPPAILVEIGRQAPEHWERLIECVEDYAPRTRLWEIVRYARENERGLFHALPRRLRDVD